MRTAEEPNSGRGSTPWWKRHLVPLVLFLSVLAIYATTAAREDMHIDAHAATVEAWHIAATGSPWLEGDLSEQMASNKFIGPAANGHTVALRMAGPVLAGVPFYWAFNNDADPEQFSFVPGGIAAALLSALTVLLLFLTVRPLLSQIQAVGVGLVFALATPTWTISADQLWTHTLTQLGIAGAGLASSRQRWWWAGISLGIAMLGRPHVALIAAVLGLGVGLSKRQWRPALAVAVPTGLALAFLLAWNHWMFGQWSIGGAYGARTETAVEGFASNADPITQATASVGGLPLGLSNYLGFLVSFDRGLLMWTPALLLMLPALKRSWKTLPGWTRWLLLGGLVYSFFQLRLNAFPGGDGFWGYRHGLELLTCLAPALAFSVPQLGTLARKLLPATLAVQFAALTIGAIAHGYYVNIIDVWSDNSFWMALRHQPTVVGPWLALCVGIAVAGTVVWSRRAGSTEQPAARYCQHSSVD